jgi:hypothetical protein
MAVASQIAQYKKANKMPVLDRAREEEKLDALAAQAKPELAKYSRILYGTLFKLSRTHQHANLSGEPSEAQKYGNALVGEIKTAKAEYAGKELPSTTMVSCQGV